MILESAVPKIVKAQKKVASSDKNAYYIDASKAPIANGAHFNSEGTLEVGKKMARAFLKHER